MTDKVLKEAFDKLTAIEEADDYVPQTAEERERDRRMRDARNKTGQEDHGAVNGYPGEHNADAPYQNYKPEEANDQYDKKTGKWSRSGQYDNIEETSDPSTLHNATIDFLDDMLASLGEEEQYSEKGDILRYAIKRLQEVGLGR